MPRRIEGWFERVTHDSVQRFKDLFPKKLKLIRLGREVFHVHIPEHLTWSDDKYTQHPIPQKIFNVFNDPTTAIQTDEDDEHKQSRPVNNSQKEGDHGR
jgi:hypothetical protein